MARRALPTGGARMLVLLAGGLVGSCSGSPAGFSAVGGSSAGGDAGQASGGAEPSDAGASSAGAAGSRSMGGGGKGGSAGTAGAGSTDDCKRASYQDHAYAFCGVVASADAA